MDKIKTTKRSIHYFKLFPAAKNSASNKSLVTAFEQIHDLSISKSEDRFVSLDDKFLYITNLEIKDHIVSGRILDIRKDIFPQLINTDDDKIRDIEAHENEGVIETTHFVIANHPSPTILALEYNHYGPRIRDFIFCLNNLVRASSTLAGVDYLPYSRDDLSVYQDRMQQVSGIVAKVHKNDVNRLESFDEGLFSAFDTARKFGDPEYVEISFKYDYKSINYSVDKLDIRDNIRNLIGRFLKDRTGLEMFKKLKVKAKDSSTQKLKEFDLLNIWMRSELTVQKHEKSRAVVSTDILYQMRDALRQEFQR